MKDNKTTTKGQTKSSTTGSAKSSTTGTTRKSGSTCGSSSSNSKK